jgi:hypothetical protein
LATRHGVADGAQRGPLRLQLVLQHLRPRAGVRARRGEGARHSRHLAGTPESWGIPSIGISGYSGFGDSTEGPYTNRNKAFEFTDNLSWFRGRTRSSRRQPPLRSVQPGGQPVLARLVHLRRPGHRIAHRRGHVGRPAFADFLLGYMRTSESAVALATTNFRAVSQAYYFTDTWRARTT